MTVFETMRSACARAFPVSLVAGLLMTVAGAVPPAFAETLNALFMSQAAYSEADVKAMTASFEKAHPGVTVNLEFVPYEALYDKIVAAKAAGGQGYDVVQIDVIWPAVFAQDNIVLDVTDRLKGIDRSAVFDGAWATVEYNGKFYGMPWILDTKYLFYNKEILQKAGISTPPKTWSQLARDAKIIKDKGLVQYPIVWSWAQAEAVICDYVTITAAGQGKFFENGKPVFDNGGALEALDFMVSTIRDGISNPNSREYLEEDVRKVFSAGEAAFALNWTYMYAKANDKAESKVAGKVGVAPAPGVEGRSTASAVNGSMALGIASGSGKPDLAWQYITHLTSQPVQNEYALLSLPIWKTSYKDAKVVKNQEELIKAAEVSIGIMTPRPMIVAYQEFSTILQKHVQLALAGKVTPEEALSAAAKEAYRIR